MKLINSAHPIDPTMTPFLTHTNYNISNLFYCYLDKFDYNEQVMASVIREYFPNGSLAYICVIKISYKSNHTAVSSTEHLFIFQHRTTVEMERQSDKNYL